jgi:hypothetical protein
MTDAQTFTLILPFALALALITLIFVLAYALHFFSFSLSPAFATLQTVLVILIATLLTFAGTLVPWYPAIYYQGAAHVPLGIQDSTGFVVAFLAALSALLILFVLFDRRLLAPLANLTLLFGVAQLALIAFSPSSPFHYFFATPTFPAPAWGLYLSLAGVILALSGSIALHLTLPRPPLPPLSSHPRS